MGLFSQKIDNLNVDNMIEELREMLYEKNIEKLYEKHYEKNIDTKVEKHICEMKHSKIIDLLDAKFEHFEQKFEGLLRDPKLNNKTEIYDLTPRTSTTPTFSSTASTRSSGTSTCSTKDLNTKKPLF